MAEVVEKTSEINIADTTNEAPKTPVHKFELDPNIEADAEAFANKVFSRIDWFFNPFDTRLERLRTKLNIGRFFESIIAIKEGVDKKGNIVTKVGFKTKSGVVAPDESKTVKNFLATLKCCVTCAEITAPFLEILAAFG